MTPFKIVYAISFVLFWIAVIGIIGASKTFNPKLWDVFFYLGVISVIVQLILALAIFITNIR